MIIQNTEDTLNPHGFVEGYYLSEEDRNNINIIRIIRASYLQLFRQGMSHISLINDDLSKYVPSLAEILISYGGKTDVWFYQDPNTEAFDNYRFLLFKIFCEKGLGEYFEDNIPYVRFDRKEGCYIKWRYF